MTQNFVFITVDSLRADYCGVYGHDEELTPTLDDMAERGILFEQAIAPGPRTPDSVPSFFTGIDPPRSGDRIGDERDLIRNHVRAHETIPELFSQRGYTTAGFTPNPYTSRYFGYDSLFDHFEDFMSEDRSRRLFEHLLEGGSTPAVALRLLLSSVQRENVFKPWEAYYEDILRWIGSAEDPYFLWIFLMDCHIPYLSRGPRTQNRLKTYYANLRWYWNDKSTHFGTPTHQQLVTAYADSIRYVDAFLDRIRRDVTDATFVITADHGEAFFDHGAYGHQPDHFYEENLHVPLVIENGKTTDTISAPVSLRQLPTILLNTASRSVTSPFATASSLGSTRRAVRGRNWRYSEPGVDVDEEIECIQSDSDSDEQLATTGRQITAHRQSSARERALIQRATASIDGI